MKLLLLITTTLLLTLGLIPMSSSAGGSVPLPNKLNINFSQYPKSITNTTFTVMRLRNNSDPSIYEAALKSLIAGPTLYEKKILKLFTPFTLNGVSNCGKKNFYTTYDSVLDRLSIHFCKNIIEYSDGTAGSSLKGASRVITTIVKTVKKPVFNNSAQVKSIAIYDKNGNCYGADSGNTLNACIAP